MGTRAVSRFGVRALSLLLPPRCWKICSGIRLEWGVLWYHRCVLFGGLVPSLAGHVVPLWALDVNMKTGVMFSVGVMDVFMYTAAVVVVVGVILFHGERLVDRGFSLNPLTVPDTESSMLGPKETAV